MTNAAHRDSDRKSTKSGFLRRTVARVAAVALVASTASVVMALAQPNDPGRQATLTATKSAAAKAKAAENADKAAKSAHVNSGAASGEKRTSPKKVGRAAARHTDLARHLAELPPVSGSGHGVLPGSRHAVHPTHAIRPQGSHHVLSRSERATVKQRKRAPKGIEKSGAYRLGAMSDSDPAPQTSSFLGFMTTAGVDTGSISGTLSDTGSGLPVAGACVESYGYVGGDDYVDGPIACSDASGQYQLTGLAEGDYDLHVTDHVTGHIETWVDNVHVAAGEAVSGINIEMDQGGIIAGAVTDAGGQPLAGVCATVYTADDEGEYDGGCTEATGHYQSVGLPDGNYKVVFVDRDGQHVRQWFDDAADAGNATLVQVSAGQVTDHIDASMTLGGSISGTVSGAGSAALEGICVSFESADSYESTCTDASGHYRSPGLPTGSYTVHFEDYQGVYRAEYYDDVLSAGAATPVSVTLGDETPDIDAILARYGQISGIVTAATTGAPIADVCVVAFDQNGEDVAYDDTALDGTYTLGGLSEGSYRVMFGCGSGDWIEQWYDGAASGADSTPVTTTLDHVTEGVDAALEPYGSISGTVTGADTGAGVADICVSVESTTPSDSDHAYGDAWTDADGHYRVFGLETGSYHVLFHDCGNQTYVERYYGNTVDADSSTPVPVTLSQDTPGIDNEMIVGGAVTGTVTAADTGTPLQACIDAYEVGTSTDDGSIGSSESSADGTYRLGGLESGSYDLRFEDCDTGAYVGRWLGGSATRAGGTSVDVTLGAMSPGHDIALPLGGSISGTVHEAATGDPVTGDVCIDVADAAHPDESSFGTTITSEDAGAYSVRGLDSGQYVVRFVDCGDGVYRAQWFDHADAAQAATPVTVTVGSNLAGVDADLVRLGQISGTVTAEDTGNPLPGVCVNVYAASDLNVPVNWSGERCTDGQGHYAVTGLPDGQLVVRFTNVGDHLGEWYNDKTSGQDADLIRVQAGDDIKNVDAALALGGSISGTVTSGGVPGVPGVFACVYAYDVATNQYVNSVTCADTDGTYALHGVPPGTYKVVVSASNGSGSQYLWWDNQADFSAATPVDVTAGDDVAGINFDLAASTGATVSGTVTLEKTSGPAPNFCVYLEDPSSLSTEYSTCVYNAVADGGYSIMGVAPADYLVSFVPIYDTAGVAEYYDGAPDRTTAQVLTVTDADVTGIDASLREGGHISGTVTDAASGDPLPNICGVLQSAGVSNYYYRSDICTDAQGQYTSPDLPGGSYTFTMSDNYGPYLSQTYPTPVDVTLAETSTGIDFALDKGGSFSGTVRDDVTNAPLSKICVVAYPVGGGPASQQRCSDTSGHYATAGLPDGTYDLEFTNPTGRYITEWYDDVSSQAAAAPLSVTPGEDTTGIDATLKLGGVVAGTVTSASTGEPLAGVCVNLYDASDDSFGGATICTGADGKYESAAIPAGQYKVGFVDSSGVYAPQYYDNKEALADADPVTVTSGGKTADVDAAMASTTVRGTVTDAVSGDPLPGVCIYLYTAGGGYSGKGTCTIEDGSYVLDGISAGDYQAAFFDPAGTHVTQWFDGVSQQADATVLTAPGDLTGVDAAMAPITTVTGTVTDSLSGDPLAGVCAYLYKVGDEGSSAAACTGDDGRVVFQGIDPGDYQLAYADTTGLHETQWYSGSGDRAGSQQIHLSDGSILTGADAALVPITTVVGQVTDAVSGDPVAGVCAYLYPVNSEDSAAASCTGPDGRVVFQGIDAGDYQLAYADTGAALATEWYGGSHLRSGADVITMAQGQAKLDADVAMDRTGSIGGTVSDGSGPVAGICVYADDVNGDYTGVGGCTDADGHYTLPDLSPGQYALGFYPPGMPTPTSIWYSDASSEAGATLVTVEAGQTTGGVDQTVP